MEGDLWQAIFDGKVPAVKKILGANPAINVNWRNLLRGQWTFLNTTCAFGHDTITAMLLAYPAIDVNLKTQHGYTPFMSACYNGQTRCARLLLKDSRIRDFNEARDDGYTPLQWMAYEGYPDIIEWWIASGREMDLGQQGNDKVDAVAIARRYQAGIAALLQRFKENPAETRHEVRLRLGWYEEAAAEVLALLVFVSDGLLRTRDGDGADTPAARFFRIAQQLPLELQMVLGYRVVGSAREIVQGKDCEAAFMNLALKCLHL